MTPLWIILARIGEDCDYATESSFSASQRAKWERVADYVQRSGGSAGEAGVGGAASASTVSGSPSDRLPLGASGTSEMPPSSARVEMPPWPKTYAFLTAEPWYDPELVEAWRDAALARIASLEAKLAAAEHKAREEYEGLARHTKAVEKSLASYARKLADAERERDTFEQHLAASRLRLRGLCQSLVNAAGADGPMSAEDAAAKLVEKYTELEAENAALESENARLLLERINEAEARSPERREEAAWLIEMPGPLYWSGREGCGAWRGATDAIRFARWEDADRLRIACGFQDAKVTEHIWCAPQAQRETDEQQNAVGTRSGASPADSHAAATCGSSVADSPLVGVAPVSESNDEGLPVPQVKDRQPAPSPAAPGAAREWDREQQQSAASVVLAAMHGPLEDVCAEIAKHAHLFAKPAPVSAEDVERACEAAWNAGGHRPAWRDLNETVRVLFRCSFRAALASLGIKAAEDVK